MSLDLHAPLLITGGSGFAGSHLVELLMAVGYSSIHITSFGSKVNLPSPNVHVHQVDLTQREAVVALFTEVKPAAIFHLASFSMVGNSFDKAESILVNNLTLQLNILEAAKQITPDGRLLNIGSAEEYGATASAKNAPLTETDLLKPINPYGVSKVAQDLLAQTYYLSFNLPVIRTRPFNHIGERQTADFVVPSFAQQIVAIERGQQSEIKVGNLEAIRDFTDVKDMVKAYLLLMTSGQPGEVYNIGSGRGYQIKDVLAKLITQATAPIQVSEDPTKFRPLDTPMVVADISKMSALGWQAHIPLEETLGRILNYWRNRS